MTEKAESVVRLFLLLLVQATVMRIGILTVSHFHHYWFFQVKMCCWKGEGAINWFPRCLYGTADVMDFLRLYRSAGGDAHARLGDRTVFSNKTEKKRKVGNSIPVWNDPQSRFRSPPFPLELFYRDSPSAALAFDWAFTGFYRVTRRTVTGFWSKLPSFVTFSWTTSELRSCCFSVC